MRLIAVKGRSQHAYLTIFLRKEIFLKKAIIQADVTADPADQDMNDKCFMSQLASKQTCSGTLQSDWKTALTFSPLSYPSIHPWKAWYLIS